MKVIDYPEGATPLEPEELEGLKFKHITTRGELDHLEQANIESGLQWMHKSKNTDILSEIYVRELHRRLFGQVWKWAGKFRTTGKNIGVDSRKISVELRKLLDDTRFWIENKVYGPQEIALRFHHRLVFIHPFPNGNGRHARIMADAILLKIFKCRGINWSGGYDLQSMGKRRKQYIQALRVADKGDYKPLFIFADIKE